MLHPNLPALAAVMALMLGSTAAPANAQQTQQQAPAAEYGDEELRAFAQASVEVQQLNEQWMPEISAAENQAEAEQLRAEATSQMVQAIQGEGLTVEDYNAIFDQARQDPDVASQIQAYQQEAQ